MPRDEWGLSGLHAVTGWLLEHLLQRPEGRSRKLPVVVALGPRGTGKTELLRAMKSRCELVPHAYLDFESGQREPREVLGKLAFELSKQWGQFGRPAFPQLSVCLLVVGSTLHTQADDRREALRQLRRILLEARPIERNRESIVELVALTGTAGGLPPWTAAAVDVLLRGLGRLDRRRLLRGVPRAPGAQAGPEDALIDLAMWSHDNDTDADGNADLRAEADALFCEAFLGDLRRAYTGSAGARRTLNCLVLLDNVHTPAGRKFLLALQEARRRAGTAFDPMVVIAASRTWIPYWSDSWHRPGGYRFDRDEERPPEHRTGTLSFPAPRRPSDIESDWPRDPAAECPWSPWYLLDLSRLTAKDIAQLAADRGLYDTPRIADFVRGLTAGHPGGSSEILAVLARTDYRARLATARRVLDQPRPRPPDAATDDSRRTVHEDMLERFLRDFAVLPDRRDLVTASAARNVDMLYRPEVLDSEVPNGEGLLETLRNHLWIRERDGAPTELEIHPWLRRILLRELAARDDTDPRDWARTHELCREVYRRGGQEVGVCYHELALGNLTAVVDYLGRPFRRADDEIDVPSARIWLTELDLITSAPNRSDAGRAPIDQVRDLVRGSGFGKDDALAWLIASLWVRSDPLGDPEQTLNETIAGQFRELARGRGPGSVLLHERAGRY
ncbi:hypothetical protein IU450_21400 [Nocardia abscessus]|uniref:hypothetical protein n=1 Tax=Nocardia abscessus TaxID=120957 RepID=UPI001894F043|nr:hypothetical protein [Nocardia abscessus]MBF6338431.1 hypothetical protein [Nocardia abscessus]